METGSRNYVTIAKGRRYVYALFITCIIELKPKEEQNVYGRVKCDYMYNISFSTSRLLIFYAALVIVLFLPHCLPLPHRAD